MASALFGLMGLKEDVEQDLKKGEDDFSLARRAQLELVPHGAVFGTPEFMSPEQASARSVGPDSDFLTGYIPRCSATIDYLSTQLRLKIPRNSAAIGIFIYFS